VVAADGKRTRAGSEGALAGCVALVTGASTGIGEATALALAAEGAAVALVARRTELLEELTARITHEGGSAVGLTADLTDAAQVERVVGDTVERLGGLDVLVNNAGYAVRGSAEESDLADWERMVDLNVMSVLRLSKAALPHLLSAARGPRGVADLVTVGSAAGRVPRKDNSVYSATKHAVGAFSEAVRQEVTGRGVRVGIVEPGMTITEMTRGSQSASGRGMPQEVWLRPEDVARSIAFMTTQPAHAAINEILVRPTAQEH
jgi:NADP-dependent 3-hydroxy acid dehydrogenase YdfG